VVIAAPQHRPLQVAMLIEQEHLLHVPGF
jgi:hypothetical protein